jgi:hypothetical protein
MASFWDDIKTAGSDAWNGKPDAVGDALAVGTDIVNTFVPILPDGQAVKKGYDGLGIPTGGPITSDEDSWGLQRSDPGQGNLGNKIGTVAGGALGGAGGPLGIAMGMDAGSEIGGNLEDFITSL